MADRKVIEVAWLPPVVTHRARVLMECGHHEEIEHKGNRMKAPKTKWCMSCDARGEAHHTATAEDIAERRKFYDWVGEGIDIEFEVIE